MATNEGDIRLKSWSSSSRKELPPVPEARGRPSSPPNFTSTEPLLDEACSPKQKPEYNTAYQTNPKKPKKPYSRTVLPLLLVLGYAALVVFAWVATCVLAVRPFWRTKYQYDANYHDMHWFSFDVDESMAFFKKNADLYRNIRVVQSLISVITLPLTTTVIAAAAIIYAQRTAADLSLRQLMVLADKSWSDFLLILGTLPFFTTARWKKYGSSFLRLAILLYALGGLISPLQQYFLDVKTIKVPLKLAGSPVLSDFLDMFPFERGFSDGNDIVISTRGLLETSDALQPQAQMWQASGFECWEESNTKERDPRQACYRGGTFSNMGELKYPFLAQLPSGYSTGLIRQYAPRINSTASVSVIPADDFPKDCEAMPGAFWASYSNDTNAEQRKKKLLDRLATWSVQACMPGNVSFSPWKPTRDSQSFTELLYLNVTVDGVEDYPGNFSQCLSITLRTTAGYFELPNYRSPIAGDILEKDPFRKDGGCQKNCTAQLEHPDEPLSNGSLPLYLWSYGERVRQGLEPWSVEALEGLVNKGPLLTLTLALFGNNSWISNRASDPAAYARPPGSDKQELVNAGLCASLTPLMSIHSDINGTKSRLSSCISNMAGGDNGEAVNSLIADWLYELFIKTEPWRIERMFTSAAFLANQAWLLYRRGLPSLTVYRDFGLDTQVPSVSLAGVVTISVLIAIHILALSSFAAYAAKKSGVVDSKLDAWAMMKIGASHADSLPSDKGADKVPELDQLSGRL